MSDDILGGWGVKWLRMWTKEWVNRRSGLRSPAARIFKRWYYGRWPSQWSAGRGGPNEKRTAFFLFIVFDREGEIVEQGSVQLLSRAKRICDVRLKKMQNRDDKT